MGILVTLAIVWLALILGVVIVYSIGPPARRLLGVRTAVTETAEEIRQKAALNRQQVVDDVQTLDWPIDRTIAKYQDARRQILPGASDHRWGEKELATWMKRETVDRSRSLRQRNLFTLIATNLAITVVLAVTAWFFYQHIQSRTRPQLHVPVPSYTTTRP